MNEAQIESMRLKRQELLSRRPDADPLMMSVVDCWQLLDSCRAIGMAVGPIPWTAVMDWCDRQPWCNAEMAAAIGRAINHLDANRRRREASKSKSQQPKPGRNPRSK